MDPRVLHREMFDSGLLECRYGKNVNFVGCSLLHFNFVSTEENHRTIEEDINESGGVFAQLKPCFWQWIPTAEGKN